ncbi:hypothetical protein VFPPC_06322 [Pochonia chlamydosporia 170]|uniref:DUF7907 domain-containing protein n=1 Tax=Pochonia chlamydosporia 170 TaxID=1380566 RepID=A0A179FHR0_METCM|nr:hypothetical protein VFPPC_06322 [Pochonia chlamydosporia 170]OAQ65165.1 hypothetical protein VFPPC_06322 [Pochonia chlamydosporia 170]
MTNFNSIFAAYAAITTTNAQLITPTDLPAISHNFHLIAHVKSPNVTQFTAGIENWQVISLPGSGCHEPLILRKPADNGTDAGTTFWFNPETTGVAYGDGQDMKSLSIPRGGHGERALSMDCSKGTSEVGVASVDDGPQLVYRNNATFYVCPRRIRSQAVAQLLYREGEEPLPYMCADVVLFAKRARGKRRGDGSAVVCCTDVRDGVCVLPIRP